MLNLSIVSIWNETCVKWWWRWCWVYLQIRSFKRISHYFCGLATSLWLNPNLQTKTYLLIQNTFYVHFASFYWIYGEHLYTRKLCSKCNFPTTRIQTKTTASIKNISQGLQNKMNRMFLHASAQNALLIITCGHFKNLVKRFDSSSLRSHFIHHKAYKSACSQSSPWSHCAGEPMIGPLFLWAHNPTLARGFKLL